MFNAVEIRSAVVCPEEVISIPCVVEGCQRSCNSFKTAELVENVEYTFRCRDHSRTHNYKGLPRRPRAV